METNLRDAMAAGVFVEFCDANGNTLGNAVYTDWHGRPVPCVGDTMCCRLLNPSRDGHAKLRGRVRARQFDVQVDEQGDTCVWVRLTVETVSAKPAARAFSSN